MKNLELIRAVSEQSAEGQAAVVSVLSGLAFIVKKELQEGGKITIPGIAILTTGDVAARVGRNPQTGEPLNIWAYTKVKFKTVKSLKDSIK